MENFDTNGKNTNSKKKIGFMNAWSLAIDKVGITCVGRCVTYHYTYAKPTRRHKTLFIDTDASSFCALLWVKWG